VKKYFQILGSSRLAIPIVLAGLVGVTTGLLAVVFIKAIALTEAFFFGGGKKVLWFLGPYYVILIPAIGGLLVGPLVHFFAPEAKGHGVPEVLKAIALRGGRIRPAVVIVKAVASAIAIGSGSSVGREGPIVQVGSALGSNVGQLFKLSELRIKNLVACGAAAGIAAVFNAPIAGVMFALEVILRDFGARALSTVVISSVASSIISRIFLGETPAFSAPSYSLWSPFELFLYLGLGILSAFAAHLFIFTLSKSEKYFDQWKIYDWLKPVVGGLAVGCIGLYVPQVFGTGLHTITDALHGYLDIKILFALIFLKTLATSISLGSGSSGGVFAPALFIGTALGGTLGKLFYRHMPFDVAPPGAYALVGMASVFSAAAHAPVTAILIVFEMSGDYRMILPIMVAVVASTAISQMINKESIYTVKLKETGIDINAMGESKVLGAIQVRDAMSPDFETVPNDMPAKDLVEKIMRPGKKSLFVLNAKGQPEGLVKQDEVQKALVEGMLEGIIAQDMASPFPEYCFPEESLSDAARLMTVSSISELPVVDPGDWSKIVGVLKYENLFKAYSAMSLRHAELVSRMERQDDVASGILSTRLDISARSLIIGKRILELGLPEGVMFTSIRRGTAVIMPRGDTVVKGKDKISIVFIPQSETAFHDWLKKNRLDQFLVLK